MTGYIDPTKARLYPEKLPESISVTSSSSGTSISTYGAFSPFSLALQSLFSGKTTNLKFRMDTDSGYAALELDDAARPTREKIVMDVLAEESMDLWAIDKAAGTPTAFYSYVLRITKLTILEKIKYGLDLSTFEQDLANKYSIKNQFDAGMLKLGESHNFKKIVEISKIVDISAGSSTRVDRLINVKRGEKAVIIGIGADPSFSIGAPYTPNNTYIIINRDIRDKEYVKLDYSAMPEHDKMIECYIPAIDRLEITVESATGTTDFPVRFVYGIADITLLEKIRWDISLTQEEEQIAGEYNLRDAVITGVV